MAQTQAINYFFIDQLLQTASSCTLIVDFKFNQQITIVAHTGFNNSTAMRISMLQSHGYSFDSFADRVEIVDREFQFLFVCHRWRIETELFARSSVHETFIRCFSRDIGFFGLSVLLWHCADGVAARVNGIQYSYYPISVVFLLEKMSTSTSTSTSTSMQHGEYSISFSNFICTTNLETRDGLNLPLITHCFRGRRQQDFPSATIWLHRPSVALSVFRTGKIVMTGASTAEKALEALYKFWLRLLMEFPASKPSSTPKPSYFTIQNVVATMKGPPIDLESFKSRHCDQCGYNPDIFPGLHYSPEEYAIKLVMFASGNIVITGGKTSAEIMQCFHTLCERFALFVNKEGRKKPEEASTRQLSKIARTIQNSTYRKRRIEVMTIEETLQEKHRKQR